MTFEDTHRRISSRGLEDGGTQLDWLDGPTTDPCGPEAVPASRSATPESGSPTTIRAISGPSSPGSSRTAALQQLLESRLQARLAAYGSPEYALTWKHWDMASGPSILALRASARRTSGNGCGGWATPAERDWRSESATETFNEQRDAHPRGKPLSYQVTQTSGPPQTGFPAPTEKRGALNPELSRWLQGYPGTWTRCAPTETASVLKRRRKS